jgi:hypothetical protein
MKKPDDFMAMFERKTHGQNKTMDELANDFSNLLPDGPFQRSWLQYAFIAGFRAGKRAQEAKIKELEIELDNWQHAATHGDDGL